MAKLELWYPAKPFITSQAWGIKNDSYLQFGFSRHNGHDFLIGADSRLYAPCDFLVYDVGDIPTGAGRYIKGITEEVEAEGTSCFVNLMFMHLKAPLVSIGQHVQVGDVIALPDSTGFSTGPHTHLSVWRTDAGGNRLDTSPTQLEANRTFNPLPYFNKFYATDAQRSLSLAQTLIKLLQLAINQLQK